MSVTTDFTDPIRARMLDLPGVSRRRMFGNEAFFTGGRMFAFFAHFAVVVRLPEEERSRVIAEKIAFTYLPPGMTDLEGWSELPYARSPLERILELVQLAHASVPPAPRRKRRSPSRRRRRTESPTTSSS